MMRNPDNEVDVPVGVERRNMRCGILLLGALVLARTLCEPRRGDPACGPCGNLPDTA